MRMTIGFAPAKRPPAVRQPAREPRPVGPARVVARERPSRDAGVGELPRTGERDDGLAATLARAVLARAARAPVPAAPRRMLARYEPGEHVQFGEPGRKVNIAGVEVEERYVIAMGDFYKDPDALMHEKKENIETLVGWIKQDEQRRAAGLPEDQQLKEEVWTNWSKGAGHKKGALYMDLNKVNEGHFEGLNKQRWMELHKRAIKLAQAEGTGSGVVPEKARIINAFANHYLTDAFSAGHQVNKVETKKRAKPSIDNATDRMALARELAAGMLDTTVRARLEREEIKDSARPLSGDWGPATDPAHLTRLLESILYWTASFAEDSFLSVPVKLAHDELNQAILSGHGPEVAGVREHFGPQLLAEGQAATPDRVTVERWQLPGDTTLAADKTGLTLKYGRGAVAATVANLQQAALSPRALGRQEIDRMLSNVLDWLPVASDAAEQQYKQAVDKAVDMSSPETRARIVRLSIREFPTAVEQFYERGLMQPRGTDAREREAMQKAVGEAVWY